MNPNIGEIRYQQVRLHEEVVWDSWKVIDVDDEKKLVRIQFVNTTDGTALSNHKKIPIEKIIPLSKFDKIFTLPM